MWTIFENLTSLLKVMPKPISPFPISRDPVTDESVHEGLGQVKTNVDVSITIPGIAVTTSCSDKEDIISVNENKC